ncbi:MAG TPA: class I SAM-dependent methyltransferase [Bacteroidetes bacterium]|nr:class I SAM-dependent methyltransferase [Bacteroidota bacterium]
MQVTKYMSDIDFYSILIDSFWNTGDLKENKMHKIHSYPAKFPAFITNKAIKYAEDKGVDVNLVADMFCGCGTTAYEATRNGKNFWGSDINPVATLIAEAKSNQYSNERLDDYFNKILSFFSKNSINKNEIIKVNERIKYWFKEEQIKDLLKIKNSIYDTISKKSKYLKLFLTAFSNILKPTSVWLTKSIKPQVDPFKVPADVIDTFSKQFQTMKNANNENDIEKMTKLKIETIDFLKKKINRPFADLIVTSPPYVTSYEYADLHQLSSLWLGYVDNYRLLREGTIGSLHHNSDFYTDVKELNKTGEDIVFKLYNNDKRKAKSTAKYFVDIQKSVEKAFEMLNNYGMILYVIGNTEYKSVRINNAKHLVESMLSSGFENIEITKRKISGKILTPYRDKKGKFTTDKNSRKVYSEEFIVIGRKKNG